MKVVQDYWMENSVTSWGGYVLKEKLKKLKQRLKEWNINQLGDAQEKLKKVELELNKLEKEGDSRQLNEQEDKLRKQLQENLWWAASSFESIAGQKARSRWIKEGDDNSRYFHLDVNWKRCY